MLDQGLKQHLMVNLIPFDAEIGKLESEIGINPE